MRRKCANKEILSLSDDVCATAVSAKHIVVASRIMIAAKVKVNLTEQAISRQTSVSATCGDGVNQWLLRAYLIQPSEIDSLGCSALARCTVDSSFIPSIMNEPYITWYTSEVIYLG